MTKKECLAILSTMAVGTSRKEKEAVEYAEKVFKKAKEAKRWKRKYLERKCENCRYNDYKYQNICKYCSHTYVDQFERKKP